MAFEIVTREKQFGFQKDKGPQQFVDTVRFSRPVTQAFAMLQGFALEFGGGNDHSLALATVHLNVGDILPNPSSEIQVFVTAGWRDNGKWDDDYKAWVSYVVFGITT